MFTLCTLLGHRPPETKPIWNDGLLFARCPRCGNDIIGSGPLAKWHSVPAGFQVAWRKRTEQDIRWDVVVPLIHLDRTTASTPEANPIAEPAATRHVAQGRVGTG